MHIYVLDVHLRTDRMTDDHCRCSSIASNALLLTLMPTTINDHSLSEQMLTERLNGFGFRLD